MNAAFAIVFARAAGFVFRAPGLSHPSVPRVVRVGVAVFLAIAIVPSVHVRAMGVAQFLIGLVSEFVAGAAIGMAASLLYDGAYAGGRIIDDYVGVKAIAPSLALVAPSGFGRVWSIALTGGFFLFGWYRYVIEGFAASFTSIAPGASIDPQSWSHFALTFASAIVGTGATIAAPAIALAFLVQVALAALSRVVPRFSSFTLAFPIVFGVVLIATAIAIPLVAGSAAHPAMLFPGTTR